MGYSDILTENADLLAKLAPGTSVAPTVQTAAPVTQVQPVQPQVPMDVARMVKANPSAVSGAMLNSQFANTREAADSLRRQGDVEAGSARDQAAALERFVNEGKADVKQADDVVSDSRADRAERLRYIREQENELRKPIKGLSDGEKFLSGLTKVVGAVMMTPQYSYSRGNMGVSAAGMGIAQGMQLLDEHIHSSVTDQLERRGKAKDDIERNQKAIDFLSKNTSEEQTVTEKLLANKYFVASKEIEARATATKDPVARESALRLSLAAEDKGNELLQTAAEREIAARRAAAAARAKAGVDAQKRSLDAAKTMADIEHTKAQTAKLGAEAQGAGGPKTEGERKTDSIVSGAGPAYQRLSAQFLNPDGTPKDPGSVETPYIGGAGTHVPDFVNSRENVQRNADTEALTQAILRIESGSNIPEHETIQKINASGIYSSDPVVRARGYQTLLGALKASDRFGKLADPRTSVGAPVQSAPTPAAEAPPDPNAPVAMIDNTGTLRNVHPSRIPGLKDQGWRVQAEVRAAQNWWNPQAGAPAPAAPATTTPNYAGMTPEEYEEQVRREQGY